MRRWLSRPGRADLAGGPLDPTPPRTHDEPDAEHGHEHDSAHGHDHGHDDTQHGAHEHEPGHEHGHGHADQELRLAFVGVGRVGTVLATAFARAGWSVPAVATTDAGRSERIREALPGVRVFTEPGSVLDEADVVFLTVPDDAVASVAADLRLYSGQVLVHTSGHLPSSVLHPAMAAGTAAASFHPLVAFADPQLALEALRGSTVAIEGDERVLGLLADLATSVGAQPVRIAPDGKPAYHAAAMLAAGGLVALLDAVVQLGRGAGLDEAGSLAIFAPLARQTLANAERLGVAAALTGPVVRGDVGTIEAHLEALHRLAPAAGDVYRALAEREIALAVGRGDLDEAGARTLLSLFPNPSRVGTI